MEYAVQVDVAPAAGAPELDALQCHGVDALLAEGLDGVERLSWPEGADVELIGFRMTTHSRGALLSLVVEASALAIAEDGVRQLIESVVERSEPLTDWRVMRCAVELSQEAFQAGLDADHAEPTESSKPSDQVALPACRFSEKRLAEMRASLNAAARGLKAFDLEHFGYRPGEPEHSRASEESATLAAGALMAATNVLIDHIMEDAETLAAEDTTAADDPGLMALNGLPPQYTLRYDARFARKFAVATISITARLTDGTWRGPACVAEQLALRMLIEEAKAVLELFELMDEDEAESLYAHFTDAAFDDVDHEMLYNPELDGIDELPEAASLRIAPMGFASWFVPFNPLRRVHPYVEDPPPSPSVGPSDPF